MVVYLATSGMSCSCRSCCCAKDWA